ncbi:EamA-like transporter family protein [Actinopolyspora xinjiangensis]|uniref:EamA-like transporter family protein n=1 Tax=Actinopolyspora xinjiangensis TaxID=405564 RepID=A0A1H0U971_9ACTN|nr:EamA family transporter [Actinopolyspora xinjiangensis]SDP62842.1 EamA-like transporter family protein [Actinopolyspora xinjiangensis]
MGPTALLLVVVAAAAHAGWNYFAKRVASGGAAFVWLTAACSTVLYLPLAALVVLRAGLPPLHVGLLGVVVSAALHLAYFVLLQRGYAVGDMSVVYPLARGTGPLLALLIAVLLLDERPGVTGVAGGLLVVLGVLVITSGGGDTRPRAGQLAGIGFGLLTGGMIALYTVWDAYAVTALALSPLLFDWANQLARVVLFAPYAWGRRDRIAGVWAKNRREVVLVGLLSPLAYLLVLFAMRLAPVSLVAPARELSIVLAALLGWWLLREGDPGRRIAGSAVVVSGVVLLGIA